MSAAANTDKLAKTILQNTVLSDFLEACKEIENSIDKFESYHLTEPAGSLTEMLKFSVYTHMMNGSTRISTNENIELSIEKFDETIKLAKGYFEYIGIKDDRKAVFRFNLDALKNNYRSSDLTTMNLSIYTIRVGIITDKELDFKNNSNTNNQKRFFDEKSEDTSRTYFEYELYDVLLAGVE
ncbi:hypothetical protein AKG39_16340 [Acetobacterium bakii]|uniref:Uncharacterized protein n=1 Tax=Acetobacterium bakii TaxID=52689 RepID=A0A0L6TWQ0_9FIRM|nr:hypothetical protein AKG39_16340 [Acetobacterium bakii]